jgi:urea transporter
MVPVQMCDWVDALLTSMTQALALFLAAIPKVIAFVRIVIIGRIIASLITRAVEAILRGIRFPIWRSGPVSVASWQTPE